MIWNNYYKRIIGILNSICPIEDSDLDLIYREFENILKEENNYKLL